MSFAAPASGVIYQSGRDYDLSDLATNIGVTTTTDDGITYYDFGTNRLHIQGTLWHDPDKEVMLFHHTSTSATATTHVIKVKETTASRSWNFIDGWSVDSDGNYVITHTGHSVEAGDALRFRNVTGSAIEQKQARVLSVTTNTITLERGYYWAGVDSDNSFTITSTISEYTRIPIYNYGKEYNNNGRVGYSDGTGVIISGDSTSAYDPDEHGFFFDQFSFLWSKGGTIVTNRPCSIDGHYDIKNTTFMSPRQDNSGNWQPVEMRSMGDGWWDNGKLININGVNPKNTKQIDVVLENACVSEVLDSWYEFSLRNFDASKNFGVCDFGHDGSYGVKGTLSGGTWSGTTVTNHQHDFEIVNSATGSNIITMWRPVQRNPNAQRGNVVTKKEVSFKFKDADSNPIEGVELYLKDNPSDYAKNATYPPATAAGSYTTTPTLLNGVINADGSVTYDYTNPFEYSATSDANGNISTLKITTSAHLHEYNADDPSAQNDYPNLYVKANNSWGLSSSNTRRPDFSDWDTDNFGGFYRVDRRSNDNTDADEFTFQFCSYNHSLSSSTQALKGLGELAVNWVLFDDQLITETKATADGNSEIDTPQKFYNRAKSYLVDNYAGETSTIVSREGNSINAGSYDVVIDGNVTDAASAFAISGNILTIKASSFVGDIQTTGTITLSNNAEVIGTYGENTVLPWEVTNVEATATLQLFNITKNLEVENLVVAGTAGNKVTSSGTYTGQEVSLGDNIRLRITCQAGTGAFLPYEAFGIATSVGISFEANQQADTIYNDNGINADNLTTLSADYPNVQIDISDGDGVADVREFYAFYVKQTTTSTGIGQWFGAIDAIDHMNYRVNTAIADIKLQNTGNTPLVISGARIFRDNGTSILHADLYDQPMTQDNGELIQYIKGQVDESLETKLPPAIASDPTISGIDKNSKLIPALL